MKTILDHGDREQNKNVQVEDCDISTKSAGSSSSSSCNSNSNSSESSSNSRKRLLHGGRMTNSNSSIDGPTARSPPPSGGSVGHEYHQQDEEQHLEQQPPLFNVALESIVGDELRDELDHVAHGNRATFSPDVVAGAPGVCCSYMIKPFKCLVESIRKCKVQLQSDDNEYYEEEPQAAQVNTAMQRLLYFRQRFHHQNHPPPFVAKGHYHTKGDPYYELPDIFGE